MNAKKIYWSIALACFIHSAAGQHVEVGKQFKQAAANLTLGIADWTMIIANGATLVERTQYSIKRMETVKDNEKELKRLANGEGFKNCELFAKDNTKKFLQRLQFNSLKIAGISKLLFQLGMVSGYFTQDVVNEAVESIGDNSSTMADALTFQAQGTALLPPDATGVVNSFKEMKMKNSKHALKKKVLEVLVMLDQLDNDLDKIYAMQEEMMYQARVFNEYGQIYGVGRRPYLASDFVTRRLNRLKQTDEAKYNAEFIKRETENAKKQEEWRNKQKIFIKHELTGKKLTYYIMDK